MKYIMRKGWEYTFARLNIRHATFYPRTNIGKFWFMA